MGDPLGDEIPNVKMNNWLINLVEEYKTERTV